MVRGTVGGPGLSEVAVERAVAIQSGMRAIIRAMSTRFCEREQLCIEAGNSINGAASSARSRSAPYWTRSPQASSITI